ncbi:MAG: stage 0 sporulation family protein [Desulfomonile sp.]|nr:stage 0 sporulation family protein [Desulfomonile sp.]
MIEEEDEVFCQEETDSELAEIEDSPNDLEPALTPAGPDDGSAASKRAAKVECEEKRVTVTLVGVRFSPAGKIYSFDANNIQLAVGDWVVMKTEKGVGLGQVSVGPQEKELTRHELEGLRKIVRKAGKVDMEQRARCAKREAQARKYCLERIEALGLPMKLVAVECFFDGSKYVFYFTSEGRVDFRELVKQLVTRFPVRIEMRQIGVRHEAKMIGGLACCGQELCCARYLTDFKPVSVRMAKAQNLSLNPTKISGVCGRLMCCLAYEQDTYEDFKKGLPKVGKCVCTQRGEGVVVKLNPLTETVQIKLDEDTFVEVAKSEIMPSPESPSKKKKGGRKSEKPSEHHDEKEPAVEREAE